MIKSSYKYIVERIDLSEVPQKQTVDLNMSKTITAVLFLAGAVALCTGFVCPPNFCRAVKCPDITEESCQLKNGVYVPNGSVCSCCPVCLSLPKVAAPGDVPVSLCPLPIIGNGVQGYYPC